MSGYPFAGKSVIAAKLAAAFPKAMWIDPKQFREPNFETMSEEKKHENNINVWFVSLDLLDEQINNTLDDEIIIYDTACANRDRMLPLMFKAKKRGHHTLFVFVKADLEVCSERAGEKWLDESVLQKYVDSFEKNVPVFTKHVNKVFVVDNNTDTEDQDVDVTKVVKYIERHYGKTD